MNNETRQEAKNIIDNLLVREKLSTQGVFEAVENGSVDYQKINALLHRRVVDAIEECFKYGLESPVGLLSPGDMIFCLNAFTESGEFANRRNI